MSRERLRKADGTPLNEYEVAQYLKARPEMRGKFNKYGYVEGSWYENFARGLKRGAVEDFGETFDYLGNLALEQTPKYKGSGRADAVGSKNKANETDYQQQTDGSFAAGLGRVAPLLATPGGLAVLGGKAATMAVKSIPVLKNSSQIQKVSQALSNFAAKKAANKAATSAGVAQANAKMPEIALLVDGYKGLKKLTVDNPNWLANAASRGALGYTATNAKDAESASLSNILGYGALGGVAASGLARAVGPSLKDVGDKLRKEVEDVKKGFSIPPSSKVHAPIGRLLEALAGKNNVATELGIKNTQNAQKLARQEIGLPPTTNPITDMEFELAKQQPNAVYNSIRNLTDAQGNPLRVPIDRLAQRDLHSKLMSDKRRTATVDKKLENVLGRSYPDPTASVPDLIQDIRRWGDMATAFKKADDNASASYISQHRKNIENSLSNALENAAPGKASEYIDARKKFAQIRDLELARGGNGEKLNAVKLAGARVKSGSDKFTGGLKDIADFAGRHPSIAFSGADTVTLPQTNTIASLARLIGPTASRKLIASRPYQHLSTNPWLNIPGAAVNHLLDSNLMPGYWGAVTERAFDK